MKQPNRFLAGAAAIAALFPICATSLAATNTAAPDYQIFIVQKSSVEFPRPPEQIDRWHGSTVSCTTDLQKILFRGADPGTQAINKQLAAKIPPACNAELGMSKNEYSVPYISKRYISVVSYELTMLQGAGGSCHGSYDADLYIRKTGKELQLKDVVASKDLPKIYSGLAGEAIVQRFVAGQRPLSSLSRIIKDLESSKGELGLVIEKNRLKVIIPGFIASCADGNDNRVPLPTEYITDKSLRAEIDRLPKPDKDENRLRDYFCKNADPSDPIVRQTCTPNKPAP